MVFRLLIQMQLFKIKILAKWITIQIYTFILDTSFVCFNPTNFRLTKGLVFCVVKFDVVHKKPTLLTLLLSQA